MKKKAEMKKREDAVLSMLQLIGIGITTMQLFKYLEFMGEQLTINQVQYTCLTMWQQKRINRIVDGRTDYWSAPSPINSYMAGKVVSEEWLENRK